MRQRAQSGVVITPVSIHTDAVGSTLARRAHILMIDWICLDISLKSGRPHIDVYTSTATKRPVTDVARRLHAS